MESGLLDGDEEDEEWLMPPDCRVERTSFCVTATLPGTVETDSHAALSSPAGCAPTDITLAAPQHESTIAGI